MRWLRAPIVHFLLGGGVVFLLVQGTRPPGASRPGGDPVVVSADDVARLRADYTRDTGLVPTAADEAALVERAIDEEVLVREALARGLDQNDRSVRNWLVEQMRVLGDAPDADPDALYARARHLGLDRADLVVRRMLVQKMRLLAARVDERRPDDAVLRAFYEAHRDEYATPERVDFSHLFFATSERGAAAAADAAATLAALRTAGTSPAAAGSRGDAFFVGPRVAGRSLAQIEASFGAVVASELRRGAEHRWIGPVTSPYGVHLLWIESREAATPPSFEQVHGRVLERWQSERRAERVGRLLAELKRRHPLQVESAAWRRQRGMS